MDADFVVSIITRIEVLGYQSNDIRKERARQQLLDFARNIDVGVEIAEKAIAIKKSKRIQLGDALVAATALFEGRTLMTRNETDFKKFEGLTILNPWKDTLTKG